MFRPALRLVLTVGMIAGPVSFALGQQSPDGETAAVRIAIQASADTTAAQILDRAGALPFGVAVRIVASGLEAGTGLDDQLGDVAARRAPVTRKSQSSGRWSENVTLGTEKASISMPRE